MRRFENKAYMVNFSITNMYILFYFSVYSGDTKLGAHAWLMICNIMTETIICLKFSENEFTVPAPMFVKVAWSTVAFIVLIAFPLWRFVIRPPTRSIQLSEDKTE